MVPCGHAVHAFAATPLNSPASQLWQFDAGAEAVAALYLPAAHASQLAEFAGLNRPAAHAVHSVASSALE